jgi:threonine synthase
LFADKELQESLNLSAVNSINWARIMAQAVYYIYVAAKLGQRADYYVPTGNFGNIYSGFVAKKLGASIGGLHIATNSNDALARFFESGVMSAGASLRTISPSMDIQIPSNFERVLFEANGRNAVAVEAAMTEFRQAGRYSVEAGAMQYLRQHFTARKVGDVETMAAMTDIYKKYGEVVDPHTAVGLSAVLHDKAQDNDVLRVALACAHPLKFPEAVVQATGQRPEMTPAMQAMMQRDERIYKMPADASVIKQFILNYKD